MPQSNTPIHPAAISDIDVLENMTTLIETRAAIARWSVIKHSRLDDDDEDSELENERRVAKRRHVANRDVVRGIGDTAAGYRVVEDMGLRAGGEVVETQPEDWQGIQFTPINRPRPRVVLSNSSFSDDGYTVIDDGAGTDPEIEEISAADFYKNVHDSDVSAQIDHEKAVEDAFLAKFSWFKNFDPFDEEQLEWPSAENYLRRNGFPRGLPDLDKTVEVPPATAFVDDLISLEIDELAENDRKCCICLEPYLCGEDEEIPLQLPCEHHVGNICLRQWLTSIGSPEQHDSCPICRAKYVEVNDPIETITGLGQLLRDVDYVLNRMGPLRICHEAKDMWQVVKDRVLRYIIERARADAAEEENERLLREGMEREMYDSTIIREWGHLMTEDERTVLQERLTGAVRDWRGWRNGERFGYGSGSEYESCSDSDSDFDMDSESDGAHEGDDEDDDTWGNNVPDDEDEDIVDYEHGLTAGVTEPIDSVFLDGFERGELLAWDGIRYS